MYHMMIGAIALASLIAGLFFLRFWYKTRDRFFIFFALSFAIEGVNRIALGVMGTLSEDAPHLYLIRLLSFTLILVGIADKNRRHQKKLAALKQPAAQPG